MGSRAGIEAKRAEIGLNWAESWPKSLGEQGFLQQEAAEVVAR